MVCPFSGNSASDLLLFRLKMFEKILFCIRVYLIYNVVLVPSVQKSGSVIHMSFLSQILFPFGLLQNIK